MEVLKIYLQVMSMMLEIFFLKRQKLEKGTFSILFTLELTKQILVWNYHPKRQLMKLKVILPKLTPMNHESQSLE
jgi:hypothetical protein